MRFWFCRAWMLHWRAYLWEYCQMPTGSCVGGNEKRVINGTSSRRLEIKRTSVTFFLLWPRMVTIEQFETYLSAVSILLCEITISLLWAVMNGTSFTNICNEYIKDISKMALNQEFLKKKMSSQNKKVNLMKNWRRESLLCSHFFIICFTFSPFSLVLKYETSVKHTSCKIHAAQVHTQRWE